MIMPSIELDDSIEFSNFYLFPDELFEPNRYLTKEAKRPYIHISLNLQWI
jgi:hypothetical protein